MIVTLVLLFCLTTTFKGITAEINTFRETEELGKSIYLRKTNILADFKEREVSVFDSLPSSCFTKTKLYHSGSYFEYYKSTKAFYSKISQGAGLETSLESTYTLGATLGTVSTKEDSNEFKVSGMSLNIRALTRKILVKRDCLDDEKTSTLTKRLLRDFESLPTHFEKPWRKNSWKGYDDFLKTFGSHVITSIKLGSSIKQTAFAKSSQSYSQRDFQVKSCVSLAGPTSVGKVGVKACANFSKSEISKATRMNTKNTLIVRGGTKETRNALLYYRTKDQITKLLNEADQTDAAVEHSFRPIWNILQSRYRIGSENYVRAVNLQYYYLGYLNYGCQFRGDEKIHAQAFSYTKSSNPSSPEFSCTLAKEGCHNDDDCYKDGFKCTCTGATCVRHELEKQDTGVQKKIAYINRNEYWPGHGCEGWFSCTCENRYLKHRKEVWRMPSRDFVKKRSGDNNKLPNPQEEREDDPYPDLQGKAKEGDDQISSGQSVK
ncbi:DELTA-alicitoxin-Pse2b-like [Montipora capricornis]|uniref:DELTA-alicitoxin-Pse2b-like n=1 Tax=Montipora capricornis TaxID=246305 RepID=UPI0035F167CF